MRKKIMAVCLAASLVSTLTGCQDLNYIEPDTSTDTIQIEQTAGDVKTPSLSQEIPVKDEDFSLVCTYDINKKVLENWRVTDSKDVGMDVHTKNLPKGYDCYIDHVHADISLKATTAQINGISQDSMDDTFHGQNQDGFGVGNDMHYYNIFNIDGYTDQFYQIWGHAFGSYGHVSSSYQRLTEYNILKVGTYAEQLTVVYDISIKKPGSNKLYTKSVISKILIPVSGAEK